jgi:2-oxoglutarate dehydrogenase E1 component
MWDEILASGDYLNQLAPSWQQEQDLHPEWKKILSSSSQDLKPAEPLVCRKETDHDLRLAIDLYRRFGYELVDLKCLFEDTGYKKRSERFWKRWKERLPEALAQDSRLAKIKANYTGALAIEPPQDPQKAAFLWQLVEEFRLDPACYQELVWKCLSRATHFEQFLHKHFVGQKRFSLEGCETLIAVLEVLFREFAKQRGKHVALGMSHRGRLNVLAHCLGKPYTHILKEFDTSFDFLIEDMGDVKYHKGHASWREFDEGKLFVEMLANPSHLESVDPVLLGFCKEQQRQKSFDEVLPLLLHGDAALSGQGVVYETLQISGVHGYGPVGILHLVVNNQVGFTAIPVESRQGDFCTDIARSFDIPVFHVSVQKPMECVRAVLMALAYRRQFKSDVFVDFIGYRKWGHNEADEPRYTNPDLYEKIDKAPLVLDLFAQDIGLEPELKKEHEGQVLNDLKDSYEKTQQQKPTQSATKEQLLHHRSEGLAEHFLEQLRLVETGTPAQDLRQWAEAIFHLPDALGVHPKIRVLYNSRLEKVRQGVGLDWACAEMLAYGSLLSGGHGVRLSGQDIVRGTFSHRQVGVKAQGEKDYIFSMNRLSQATKRFEAYNSPLSEFAVLGFEYGYSLAASEDLVIWEAQFGDFANGAQVMIDQFISSAQSKWGINSRLTLFLPHGFEGQGPEHSSARIERFLALSARGNWCVAQVSTPHQLFHLIRRQMLQPIRRPLVLFTPKALLRHPECISSIEAFTHHRFNEIILDAAHGGTRAVLCSGKLYYDIASLVKESGAALLRLEQLYPLALDTIFEILGSMQELKEVIWIQEEPINMGPSVWIRQNLQGPLLAKGLKWTMLGRDRTNCIATGYPLRHKLELEVLMYQLREALKN